MRAMTRAIIPYMRDSPVLTPTACGVFDCVELVTSLLDSSGVENIVLELEPVAVGLSG